MKRKILCVVLCVVLVFTIIPLLSFADNTSTNKLNYITILYTGNLKGSIKDNIGLDGLVAYTNEKKDKYNYVSLIDSGNDTAGTILADKTNGELVVSSMNLANYSISVPGVAELKNGIQSFMTGLKNLADFSYISSNIYYLDSKSYVLDRVLPAYKIETYGQTKVAYVGVTNFDAMPKNTKNYFVSTQYSDIQNAIDNAKNEKADIVILVGNVDSDDARDIIKNTTGVSCFINSMDEVISGEKVSDKDSKSVILTSTGESLDTIGVLTIYTGTLMTTQLLNTYNAKNIKTQEAIDTLIDEKSAVLGLSAGTTQYKLTSFSTNGDKDIECGETNLGDLVADSAKIMTNAEIALIPANEFNGNLLVGDISYNDITQILPTNDSVSVIELKGSQLMDVLEMSVRNYPKNNEYFLQVSGVSFDIQEDVKTSVKLDYYGNFKTVDDEYRITNVTINGASISLTRTYKVAVTNNLLSGDGGYTMIKNAKVTKKDATQLDQAFIDFMTYGLSGKVDSTYEKSQLRIDSLIVTKRSQLDQKIQELADEKIKNYVAQINNLKSDMAELNEIYALTSMTIDASSSFYIENGKRRVKVTWKTSESVSGLNYQIYRATSKTGTYKKMFTTKNMQYTNTAVSNGYTYYYKVRAYKTIKGKTYYSDWSNISYRTVNK